MAGRSRLATLRERKAVPADEFYTPIEEVEDMLAPSLPALRACASCHILLPCDSPESSFVKFLRGTGLDFENRYLGDPGGWDMGKKEALKTWQSCGIAIGNPPFSLISRTLYDSIVRPLRLPTLFIVPLTALTYKSVSSMLLTGEAAVVKRANRSYILPDGTRKHVGTVWLATYGAMEVFPTRLPPLKQDRPIGEVEEEMYPIDGEDCLECPTCRFAPASDMPPAFACPITVLASDYSPFYRLTGIRHTFTRGRKHFYRAFLERKRTAVQ